MGGTLVGKAKASCLLRDPSSSLVPSIRGRAGCSTCCSLYILPTPLTQALRADQADQQPANLEIDSSVTFMWFPSISAGRPSLIWLVVRGEEERTAPFLLIQEEKRKPHHGTMTPNFSFKSLVFSWWRWGWEI